MGRFRIKVSMKMASSAFNIEISHKILRLIEPTNWESVMPRVMASTHIFGGAPVFLNIFSSASYQEKR